MLGVMLLLMLLFSLILGFLFWCLLTLYDEYCYQKKRRKQFERFMQKRFLMQADSLEAYQEMLRMAFREKGSGEKDGEKNQDA